jgi:hypothetical protein
MDARMRGCVRRPDSGPMGQAWMHGIRMCVPAHTHKHTALCCNGLQRVVLSCDVVWAARQGRTSAQPPMPLFVADNERRHRHARLVCT